MPSDLPNQIVGDLHVVGRITMESITLPNNAVRNENIASDAKVAGSKVGALIKRFWSQPNTAAAAVTQAIHRAAAAGSVTAFRAGVIGLATGDSTVTVDLRKNGVSILTGVITITSASPSAAYGVVVGAISAAAYVAGDVFDIVVTPTVGTGTLPTGLFVQAIFNEDPT